MSPKGGKTESKEGKNSADEPKAVTNRASDGTLALTFNGTRPAIPFFSTRWSELSEGIGTGIAIDLRRDKHYSDASAWRGVA